jgi:ActR/RegA family two-component response regulator
MFDSGLPGLEELKDADDSMVVAAITGWARVEAAASARRLAAVAELVARRVERGSPERGRW